MYLFVQLLLPAGSLLADTNPVATSTAASPPVTRPVSRHNACNLLLSAAVVS